MLFASNACTYQPLIFEEVSFELETCSKFYNHQILRYSELCFNLQRKRIENSFNCLKGGSVASCVESFYYLLFANWGKFHKNNEKKTSCNWYRETTNKSIIIHPSGFCTESSSKNFTTAFGLRLKT